MTMIGKTLSHYRITEKIGAGGMGEVYRARDEHLDRDVAIKVLPEGTLADEKAHKRFRKEALALSKLSHPNIATVFDFDTQEGVDYLVMEYVEGASLAEKLKSGALPEKEVTSLGAQIAEALEEAHERGVVHRDLKPGNIAVTPKGRVKVLDFGLARLVRPVSDEATTAAMTEELAVGGTLPYMSPEELRGERADHRSDLYSFGVVLYEIATGRRPFEEKLSTALTNAIINQAPEAPSTHNRQVSPGLESIIIKALDKEPEHRYQSAREMRVDLERLSAPTHPAVPTRIKVATRRWVWAIAGLAVILMILASMNVGGLRDWLLGESGPGPIESIAVLPLENLSGDPEQEYFADGMTDELIGRLAQISALKVISRTSVMQYKGARKPLPEIARELRVDAVVVGSVRRSEGRVRITAQLIEATTDRHLWAENYERELSDVLTLQSEVAQAIAQEIQIAVTPEEEVHLARARPVDPAVYEACIKAEFKLDLLLPEEAKDYIQEAIDRDPGYAPAYAYLARYYQQTSSYLPPNDVFPKARAAAAKALELDATLAEAHVRLGFTLFANDWDWSGAEKQFRRALELNPGLESAHSAYSFFLSAMGRHEEAIAEAKKAQELDPLSPSSNAGLGSALRFARRYDEAIKKLQETVEIHPNNALAYFSLGLAYGRRGMYEEAVATFQQAITLSDEDLRSRAMLAHAYALLGRRDEALKILDELLERAKSRYAPPVYIACIYAGLGDKDQALQWFEKAYESRDSDMCFYKYILLEYFRDAGLDDLRFKDLLRRMNFPE